jgi:hypothetical protein
LLTELVAGHINQLRNGKTGIDTRNLAGCLKEIPPSRCQWLTPIILATQEAEIRRIMVQVHLRQIVHETLS